MEDNFEKHLRSEIQNMLLKKRPNPSKNLEVNSYNLMSLMIFSNDRHQIGLIQKVEILEKHFEKHSKL